MPTPDLEASLREHAEHFADSEDEVDTLVSATLRRLGWRTRRAEAAVKWCPKCRTFKAVAEFRRNSSRPDGLDGFCKACRNA